MKLGKMKEIMEIFLLLFGLCYFGDMLQINEKTIKILKKKQQKQQHHPYTHINSYKSDKCDYMTER